MEKPLLLYNDYLTRVPDRERELKKQERRDARQERRDARQERRDARREERRAETLSVEDMIANNLATVRQSIPEPETREVVIFDSKPGVEESMRLAQKAAATPKLIKRKSDAEWEKIARDWGFADTYAVAAWQENVGLEGDGKMGPKSIKKYKEMYGDIPLTWEDIPGNENNQYTPYYISQAAADGVPYYLSRGTDMTPPDFIIGASRNNWPKALPVSPKKFKFQDFVDKTKLRTYTFGNKLYARYDPNGIGDYFISEDGKVYTSTNGGLGSETKANDDIRVIMNPYYRQGGRLNRINYFQQGGIAQPSMQDQIVQLVQAAMQGDQKATLTIDNVMNSAKNGDQQAVQIANMIQEVVKQLQSRATVAKWGSKLGYIQRLKYNRGGKCPACEAKRFRK